MRVTFKVLDSLSLRPLGTRPSELPEDRLACLRAPASRGLPSSGLTGSDPDRRFSRGRRVRGAVPSGAAVGGILCFYRRCLALVRCSHTASHRHRTSNRHNSLTVTRGASAPPQHGVVFGDNAPARGDAVALWPAPGPTRGRGRGARGRGTYVLESPRAVAALDGPPVRGRSPAPHMMTRARARPRTGAARDRYIFGFQAPFQFIHGMRSRGGAGRAHGAQFAITLLLHDWR